ncbi:Uncharacterised protein [Legionella pneumophila]|nr:Uncharacterised protein [Legionella pneumophila]
MQTSRFLATGIDSPVSGASLTLSADNSKRRASAAIKSPLSKRRISPGTISEAAITFAWPSRSTVALGAAIC